MTLNTLQVFLTLVEEMNFTRAAQRLFITQQSLSGHIKRLEDEYGVQLFERRPSLKLTAQGENMVFYARQIMQAQNDMVSDFADYSSTQKASLDLGLSYMRSMMMGAGIWNRFHVMHPHVQVRLKEANTTALLENLLSGQISMMVGVDIRRIPGIRVVPLMREKLCCVVKRGLYQKYLGGKEDEGLSRGDLITLPELEKIPIMFPAKGNRLRTSLERMYRSAGKRPRVLLESERQDVLYQLACGGEGAAILSPMVLYDRYSGGLTLPPDCHVFCLKDSGISTISLAVPEDVHLPVFAQDMARIIQETFLQYGEEIGKIGLRG